MAEKEAKRFGNFMEDAYGFAQGVKVGDTIYVAGQTAFGDEGVIGIGDMATQMREAYKGISRVLAMFDATLDDVVDETLFVTDMNAAVMCAREVRGEAYGGTFDMASTLCEIKQLGSPDILIEIKCQARV